MNTDSRTINSIRNITIGFLGQFVQTILGFINRTIFIKFLATEYLGVSGLFTNILSILSLAELGVGSAIIYALYKPLAEKDREQVVILMKFYGKAYRYIGITIAIIGLSIMPFLNFIIKDAPDIKENLHMIFFLYLFNTVITYFFSYKNSIIVADQKNYIPMLISYGISFVQTVLQIVILIITKNFLLYLLIQCGCSFVYNLIISFTANKMYPFLKEKPSGTLEKNTKKNLIINIKALMITKLSGVLVNNTDNIIITYFSGLSTVGLSSNYNMLIGIVNTVLMQLFGGITASVGNLNAKESKEKREAFFNIVNFANFWLFGFSSICIILLANDVIKLWIGEEYVLPASISIILAINFYMVGMQNAIWTFKTTMGMFRYGKYLVLVTAIINLIFSIMLGKQWGLFGILLSTAIARVLTNTWYDPYAVYKYGFEKSWKTYLYKYIKFIIVLVGALITTGSICCFINVNSFLELVIKTIICLVIPNFVIVIFFYNSKEFSYFKDLFLNILKNIYNIFKIKYYVK